MFSQKILLRIFINTVIGAILVYFFLKIVDLNQVIAKFSEIKTAYIIPFVGFFLISALFRALRLKLLLSEHDQAKKGEHRREVPLKTILQLNFLSQLLSFLIPIRAGEVAKGLYISNHYQTEFKKALIWIFLDRFLDFWLVLLLSLILLQFVTTSLPQNINFLLALMTAVFSGGFLLTILFPTLVKKIVLICSPILIFRPVKKIVVQILNFTIDTTSFLRRSFKETSLLIVLTILALVSDGLMWYSLLRTVFGEPDLLKTIFGSLISSLTYLIPAAPGYVGSAQVSGVAVFGYGLGFDITLTSVVAILMHGLTLLLLLLCGILSLYALKFDLNSVWRKFKNE